jgi:hypothetical protein
VLVRVRGRRDNLPIETKHIDGTAKTNYLSAKRRLQKKSGVKTGKALSSTSSASCRFLTQVKSSLYSPKCKEHKIVPVCVK